MTETKTRELIEALIPVIEDFKSVCRRFGIEGRLPSIVISLEDDYASLDNFNEAIMWRNHLHPEEWEILLPDKHVYTMIIEGEG